MKTPILFVGNKSVAGTTLESESKSERGTLGAVERLTIAVAERPKREIVRLKGDVAEIQTLVSGKFFRLERTKDGIDEALTTAVEMVTEIATNDAEGDHHRHLHRQIILAPGSRNVIGPGTMIGVGR